ncbi:chromate transporter [Synergistaceae bacterium OttesenSCG-928-I11]|nr:chromate transporter [Synergistaceae bacterium OttesenSCG-928-I11]
MIKKLFDIALSFAKTGITAYGGGPSMVPILKAEVVDRKKWIGTEDFMDALAIGNALPGLIVIKMAAVVGTRAAGWLGCLIAMLAIVLPSSVAMFLIAGFVQQVSDNPVVASALRGLRPVVVAMLAYASWDMAPSALKEQRTIAIALIALTLMIYTGIHPALVVVMGAALGIGLKL